MKRLALVVIALTVVAAPGAFAQDPARLLKAAINTEMVDSDPKAAIEVYKKVVASGNRALAAEALLRMAGCYQKLGDAEAQKIYAQIVANYADQAAVVAEARARLGASPAAQASAAMGPFKSRPPDRRLGFYSNVSPDGKVALETTGDFFPTGLVELDLATGRQRVLLSVERDGARLPGNSGDIKTIRGPMVWSPDSRQIAFVVESLPAGSLPIRARGLATEVRTLVRATGEMRTIAAATGPGNSADLSGPVAWTTGGEILFMRLVRATPPPTAEYFMVSEKGGEPRRILENVILLSSMLGRGDRFGDLLPNGKAAVLIRSERLTLFDLTTGVEKDLTLGIGVSSPRVSADGKLIAFLSRQSETWALYVAPLDRLPIRNPIKVAEIGADISLPNRPPQWAADGTLTYAYPAGSIGVYRIDVDSQTTRSLGAPERLGHLIKGRIAWVSPDGRQIAYSAADVGIVVMDADGSNARRLVASPHSVLSGIGGWRSPDEVIFRARDAAGAAHFSTINTRTGSVTSVASTPPVSALIWQYLPATQEIFFVSSGSLMAHSLAGGTGRRVAALDSDFWRLSPDGTRIAVVHRDRGMQLLRINGDDTAQVVGSLALSEGAIPAAWSPSGGQLIYLGGGNLRVLDVNTMKSSPLVDPAAMRTLFDPETTWRFWGDASWAPDGSFIAATISTERQIRLAFEGVTADAVARLMASRGAGRLP